jgi:hypothetical protein
VADISFILTLFVQADTWSDSRLRRNSSLSA